MDISKKFSLSFRTKAIVESIKQKEREIKELEDRLSILQKDCKCPDENLEHLDNRLNECNICTKIVLKKKRMFFK